MPDFVAWHNRYLADHIALRDELIPLGYRFLSLSVYAGEDQLYAAVMVKRDPSVGQHDWPAVAAPMLTDLTAAQALLGFYPIIVAATEQSAGVLFAVVFEQVRGGTRLFPGLASGNATKTAVDGTVTADLTTIQGRNLEAAQNGRILLWAASYGLVGSQYAGIWIQNTSGTLWNNDGVADDASALQDRFVAERAAGNRPALIAVSPAIEYLSLFVAGEIGPWVARHGLTAAEYQSEFDYWRDHGYLPLCVQGGGIDGDAARFGVVFAQQEDPIPKRFTAVGPAALAPIDADAQHVMAEYPEIRQASLAIVKDARLVYSRGYTLAEPDWPLAFPATRFRLASGSKTVTALAVFQLIETGRVGLTELVQDILRLTTPNDAPPVDNRFGQITVQHLLEHTSGLDPDTFSNGPAVVQAFKAANRAAALPVTQAMTDSYLAGLSLWHDPGTVQQYSNTGYYLLGRIVATRSSATEPIDAYQSGLLDDLGITRIRASVDLLADQPPDEARYETAYFAGTWNADLEVAPSQMTPAQPLVVSGYGDDHLSLGQGAGGLSGAAPDVARLAAVFIDPHDNPALQRSTIDKMLSLASIRYSLETALKNSDPRAGYGLDAAEPIGKDRYHANKGGLLHDAASVLSFNGDWGFVALFASAANRGRHVYPDWPEVMTAAKAVYWGRIDLFPCYRMRSLAVAEVAATAQVLSTGEFRVFGVDTYGAVTVWSRSTGGAWSSGARITAAWSAPLGARLAGAPSLDGSGGSDVFVVVADGRLTVAGVGGSGAPVAPHAISSANLAPAGAGLAVASSPGRTDVLVATVDGQLAAFHADEPAQWSGPVLLGHSGMVTPGASLATSTRSGATGQVDAFVVDRRGALTVWSAPVGGGWSGPRVITKTGFALPGSALSASREFGLPGRTDVFVIDVSGRLCVCSADAGGWSTPKPVSGDVPLTPGGPTAASAHAGASNQTDVFAVGADGSLWEFSVRAGTWFHRPVAAAGFAPVGGSLVAGPGLESPATTEVLVVDAVGVLRLLSEQGSGAWAAPQVVASVL